MQRPINPKEANYLNWGEMSSGVLLNSWVSVMSGSSIPVPYCQVCWVDTVWGQGLVKWLKSHYCAFMMAALKKNAILCWLF